MRGPATTTTSETCMRWVDVALAGARAGLLAARGACRPDEHHGDGSWNAYWQARLRARPAD
jgi:hypothetical protein